MLTHNYLGNCFKSRLLSCAAACVVAGSVVLPMSVAMADDDTATLTPIKHVIIIIGENRTFDHVFATYTPVSKNDTVLNLLSHKRSSTPMGRRARNMTRPDRARQRTA